MQHVLTVKIPPLLLQLLEKMAKVTGESKGAVVRRALERWLHTPTSGRDVIGQITAAMARGKPLRHRTNWDAIRRKVRPQPGWPTPEDEVRLSRRRGQ